MKKKAIQLMIETYVMIALALLVAVVLIVMWDVQTGKFSGYVKELIGRSNIDSTVAACNTFVVRQATYEYCCSKKEVKYEAGDGLKKEEMTCSELAEREFGIKVDKMDCEGAGCQR
jgi:hypothetical protein